MAGTEDDVDAAMHLVAAMAELLEGRSYRVAVSAIGVLLTELAAAHDPHKREQFLRMLVAGVRRDMATVEAAGKVFLTPEGGIVWH